MGAAVEPLASEAWVAALASKGAALPETAGVDLVVQHEVAGAPDGKVRFFLVWANGQIREAAIGKHPEPDVLIAVKAAEAIKLLNGEMSVDVAYMQGRLKVDGDYRKFLIDLRAWRESEPYKQLWSEMASVTEPLDP